MGGYKRQWEKIKTTQLDSLIGRLEEISSDESHINDYDKAAIADAVLVIGRMKSALEVIENSLATRSKPAFDDVKNVLFALTVLEKNTVTLGKAHISQSLVVRVLVTGPDGSMIQDNSPQTTC